MQELNSPLLLPVLALKVITMLSVLLVALISTALLIGKWAIGRDLTAVVWQKIDNTDAVTSVNGYTGAVVLTQPDIAGTVPTSRTIRHRHWINQWR